MIVTELVLGLLLIARFTMVFAQLNSGEPVKPSSHNHRLILFN